MVATRAADRGRRYEPSPRSARPMPVLPGKPQPTQPPRRSPAGCSASPMCRTTRPQLMAAGSPKRSLGGRSWPSGCTRRRSTSPQSADYGQPTSPLTLPPELSSSQTSHKPKTGPLRCGLPANARVRAGARRRSPHDRTPHSGDRSANRSDARLSLPSWTLTWRRCKSGSGGITGSRSSVAPIAQTARRSPRPPPA